MSTIKNTNDAFLQSEDPRIVSPASASITYYQSTEPTGVEGDYWIDSDTNKTFRYDGVSWESVQDDDIASALLNAQAAQTTADGKIYTWAQATAPTADGIGDLWLETDNDNKL